MRRGSGAGAIAALALTCVFGAALLMSLAVGAGVYRRVAERVERSAGDRVGLTYITARIHSFDESGLVRTGEFGGQDALYLLQEVDGLIYENILYVYDGWLRELLCEQGWELDPEDGRTISQARSLTIGQPSPGLLELTCTGTDGRVSTANVYVRSGG